MALRRLAIVVSGVVQGVGFRPFVFREATSLGLVGWVRNDSAGVQIEVEGEVSMVEAFCERLRTGPPPGARVRGVRVEPRPLASDRAFVIVSSEGGGDARPTIPADMATCLECSREIATGTERRYRYPFTNCTVCGPRYSIISSLPYDRPRTMMSAFAMCSDCEREYRDPSDRRFHAQPIACPACGPRLRLVTANGTSIEKKDKTLLAAAARVREGEVLALKGLGGYQLVVDATREDAVARLRERKHREAKPFAVLVKSLEVLRGYCDVSQSEAALLESQEAPIVLVRRRRDGGGLADGVAPGNPRVGALLPNTPLHRLFADEVGRPVVCTSGNRSGEPICIEDAEALTRLAGIADLFLMHDRPIARPVDDSVARVGAHGPYVLRRARGYAPLAITLAERGPRVLALGAHMKSTIALGLGDEVVLSQHLGDLEAEESVALLERTIADLVRFYSFSPELVACDLHPDYASTRIGERLARELRVPLVRVQHHHAHVAACAAEHHLAGPVLGFAWDGTGFGPDGTIWGGEALCIDGPAFERVAHLRTFRLPGGDAAIADPRRSALGVLFAISVERAERAAVDGFGEDKGRALLAMLERGANAPETSSVGRLFDAVAAMLGLASESRFEGQAAMALEFAAADRVEDRYALALVEGRDGGVVWDWAPLVESVLEDVARGIPTEVIAAGFHAALAEGARAVAERAGVRDVVLSGGCFQNERLRSLTIDRLRGAGFRVHAPSEVPTNDGGIALGQVLVAMRSASARSSHS
ncbi:MAG: carbamoyltransferase HypF [Polyangiaceae bacterium]